ncbi:2-oxoacid:acceptor oxidoreductase family protein [Candidatus Gracilibacteria bacterium]|nr:2-oxoacid:acceptor oxidoreductase family protein [Candidatus Gracilibacteria bacterium]
MKSELCVRWHSRAGQGAVTAATFFGEACATLGYKVQSFPDFGAEKRGAPVVVFNRISKSAKILDDPAHLTTVDLVVLLDPTLLGKELDYVDILKHLNPTGTLVINTSKEGASLFNKKFQGTIFHLNATKIALDTIKRNIPNVAMMGGLTTILGLDHKKMKTLLNKSLSNSFAPSVVEKNLKGFVRGMSEVKKIK